MSEPECPICHGKGCMMCDYETTEGTKPSGPLATSEAELLALEQRHDDFIKSGKRIREHLKHCDYSDQESLDGFDDMLKYIGVYEEIVNPPVTQPSGEMAVPTGD